jgi:PAS domain S-box-containing protein
MEKRVKSKTQLLNELAAMRYSMADLQEQIADLENLIIQYKETEKKLQSTEERFHQVILSISDHIYVTEMREGSKPLNLYISPHVETMTGYPKTPFMDDWSFWPLQVIHPDDRAAAAVQAAQLAQGHDGEMEYRLIRSDDRVIWVRDSARVETVGGSKMVYGVVADITERKHREMALANLLDLSRTLVTIHNPALILDKAIKLAVAIAPAADRGSLQLLDEDGQTMRTVAISSPDESLKQTLIFRPGVGIAGHALANNQTINVPDVLADERFVPGSLELRFRSLLVAPLVVKGRLLGTLSLSSEKINAFSRADETLVQLIADQIAAALENARLFASQMQAEKLRKAHQFLQAIIDALPAHIAILDETGQIIAVNANWHHHTAARPHPGPPYDLGTNYLEVCETLASPYVEEGVKVAGGIRQVMARERSQFYLEYPIEDPGQNQWYGVRITRFQSDGAIRIIVAHEDITEQKQLESQFLQSQKMEAMGRLAGGVAHDFNNLLTVIKGYSEMLLMNLDVSSPLRPDVEEIHWAGEQAVALTQQLLVFSRQEVVRSKIIDLNAVVGNMEKMFSRVIGEDIHLITILDSNPGWVRADPGQMEQVIMNLVINARDAMPQGGRLTIETDNVILGDPYLIQVTGLQPGCYIRLAVSDTGIGMAEDVQTHLFEPFYTTKERGKGTGLGLSTVYGIIKLNNGSIQVQSKPGQGTTFRIYLPYFSGSDNSLGQQAEPLLFETKHGTETILLVEDEEGVRELARRVLSQQGYQVLVARHGYEALHLCEQHKEPIHLLLTDVVMPHRMSGRELAERLKPLLPKTKVLYMSGYTDNVVMQYGIHNHNLNFLAKPFNAVTLIHKVREVLDAPG